MDNPLISEKLKNLNTHFTHPAYNYERQLLRAIKMGQEPDAIEALDNIHSMAKPTLANNTIRSVRNCLIASCTLYTRASIDAGIDEEDAFNLSDIFIKKIENINTEQELIQFESEMALEFLRFVKRERTKKYQYPISRIVKYIYEHATEKVTLTALAEMVHLSPDYLSKLFFNEIGMHVTDFILINKVEVAKNFLEFSEMTITEISTLLQFCNPAYFSRIFKKVTSSTPNEYRKAVGRE